MAGVVGVETITGAGLATGAAGAVLPTAAGAVLPAAVGAVLPAAVGVVLPAAPLAAPVPPVPMPMLPMARWPPPAVLPGQLAAQPPCTGPVFGLQGIRPVAEARAAACVPGVVGVLAAADVAALVLGVVAGVAGLDVGTVTRFKLLAGKALEWWPCRPFAAPVPDPARRDRT